MLGDDYGDMSMDISFVIDGNSYTIHPTGDVAKYVLDENYSLLKGSLSDDITISGKQYDASISTNQLVGSPTLNAGIVLTPDDFDTNDNALQIMFHFGTPIMETDAKDAYLSFLGQADDQSGDDDTISASENISATVQPQSTVGKLTVVGQATGKLKPTRAGGYHGSGTGSKLYVYKGPGKNKRIHLVIVSYTKNIRANDFSVDRPLRVGISSARVRLTRSGQNTSISSVDDFSQSYNKKYFSKLYNSELGPFIKDILGLLNIPVNTISSILSGSGGRLTVKQAGKDSYVFVKMSNPNINMNKKAKGLAASFNIQADNNLTGKYSAIGRLTYLVETYYATFTIKTTSATVSVTI